MRKIMIRQLLFLTAISLAFAVAANPVFSQASKDEAKQATSGQQTKQATSGQATSGQEMKVSGVIVKRDADTFTLRDQRGTDVVVTLTNTTEVKEKKSNPFRRARNYATTQILRGLNVEVEGRQEGSGNLIAEEVKFTDTDLKTATSVESRVTPVEGRLTDTEGRLSQSEKNAQRLSGQVDELSSISNAARGGAKAAQETADAAIAGVTAANEKITATDARLIATNE